MPEAEYTPPSSAPEAHKSYEIQFPREGILKQRWSAIQIFYRKEIPQDHLTDHQRWIKAAFVEMIRDGTTFDSHNPDSTLSFEWTDTKGQVQQAKDVHFQDVLKMTIHDLDVSAQSGDGDLKEKAQTHLTNITESLIINDGQNPACSYQKWKDRFREEAIKDKSLGAEGYDKKTPKERSDMLKKKEEELNPSYKLEYREDYKMLSEADKVVVERADSFLDNVIAFYIRQLDATKDRQSQIAIHNRVLRLISIRHLNGETATAAYAKYSELSDLRNQFGQRAISQFSQDFDFDTMYRQLGGDDQGSGVIAGWRTGLDEAQIALLEGKPDGFRSVIITNTLRARSAGKPENYPREVERMKKQGLLDRDLTENEQALLKNPDRLKELAIAISSEGSPEGLTIEEAARREIQSWQAMKKEDLIEKIRSFRDKIPAGFLIFLLIALQTGTSDEQQNQ